MTRKIAALALGLTLVLAACGGAGEDDDGGGGSAGAPGNTAGFDGKTIKLGVLTPLSGTVAVIGQPLTAGNEVWFEALNAKGGVAGKYKVELVQEDTQYKTDIAVQKYNKIKSDVVAFTQVLGTAPTLAVLPQLKTDKILAAPASLDALWVREENLLPVGGPYQVQAINAMEYHFTDGGGTTSDRICTMIQDDVYGEAGQQGIDFAAEKYGFTVTNTQKFKVGTENYAGQIGALAGAGCQVVFLVATPSDAAKIWGTAAQARFAPQWFGQSPSYTGALAKSAVAPYMQQSVLIVSEGTEWGDNSVPGMTQMVADATQYASDQEPDYYFAFGYNQARAMTAVLEKAVELGDLSREGILRASNELDTVTFDGLTGDYRYGATEDRNPPRSSTVFKVDPSKPFGLAKVKYNFSSDAAKEFEFKKADL
ncbi:ABC transporter substrate-binding protein [Actinophytocola algeriensis]|uniref:ABC-type branched-subunit amino acid transport system substrate-binding protein n=1 Tax=Actinophytocola algeriensis TaxID=1768010 RepID=A0A7W7QBD3_9PSEU|nr:ABC transporter substrate-binding protein [Actinophytocola algeriensis]MBB4910464.1 ABC-type branched-subunit amino acid transport system substrate-binding protein [Actinophytocola algeriensis]MBE1480547.1 ABC-type branched-subunit amino acid transport system substrate-binding protein [Actinophytocola algeriensis]